MVKLRPKLKALHLTHHHYRNRKFCVNNQIFMMLNCIRCQSSDDNGLGPASTVLGHTSPTHQLLHLQHHHQHLNPVTTVNYPTVSAHAHPMHSVAAAAAGISMTTAAVGSSTAAASIPTVSTVGYPENIYGVQDFNELGQSEHYIYVTYPPELKRRLLERYGREIYLMLLRKN